MKRCCAVCKSEENLTRHHILPRMYSEWLRHTRHERFIYKKVVLCELHHVEYEKQALNLKIKLAQKYAPSNIRRSCLEIVRSETIVDNMHDKHQFFGIWKSHFMSVMGVSKSAIYS